MPHLTRADQLCSRSRLRAPRLAGAVLVAVVCSAFGLIGPPTGTTGVARAEVARAPAGVHWQWPVDPPHRVVRPFIAPASPYSSGHRGVDLAAATASVYAPADGIVFFSGRVVDRGVLSIRHSSGMLSSFEPVSSDLVTGDPVRTGQNIGTLEGGHCSTPCLHLGVRRNGEYINPMALIAVLEHAVLLPTRRPSTPAPESRVPSPDRGLPALGSRVTLSPWMRQTVGLLEPFRRHVRVQLGRSEARVAQYLLNCSQISTAIEEVGGGGVADRMGSGRPAAGKVGEERRDEPVYRAAGERPAGCSEEQVRRVGHRHGVSSGISRRTRHGECGATVSHVNRKGSRRRNTERNDALLRSLPQNPHGQPLEIDVGLTQAHEFANPQSRRVQQLHDGLVALSDRVTARGPRAHAIKNQLDLIPGQHARQMLIGPRGSEADSGIALDVSGMKHPRGEAPNGCRAARHGRFCEILLGRLPQPVAEQFEIEGGCRADSSFLREFEKPGQVGAIGANRVLAEAALVPQESDVRTRGPIEVHGPIVGHRPIGGHRFIVGHRSIVGHGGLQARTTE